MNQGSPSQHALSVYEPRIVPGSSRDLPRSAAGFPGTHLLAQQLTEVKAHRQHHANRPSQPTNRLHIETSSLTYSSNLRTVPNYFRKLRLAEQAAIRYEW
uniref:Uncharacterized protein n=1 Tax=Hyaloperonospora arabidopsidis (strain Emoy2) TaxID=559515 RepID=M4BSD1_HYAAE